MSDDFDDVSDEIDVSGMDQELIRSFYKKLTNIEEQKKELGEDAKQLKNDYKDRGMDAKAMAAVAKLVKIAMKNRDKLKMEQAIVQEVAEICRVELP